MKNKIQIAILLMAVALSSCAGMKKSTGHSKEEVMKVDASAQAQVECKHDYIRLQHLDNTSDIKLKNEYTKLQEDQRTIKQTFFKKYQESEEDLVKFQSLVKKYKSDLSICQKLTEYQEAQAEKKKQQEKKK